jgi:ribosomal protein S27E
MVEGYCVKCKARKEISDGVEETMKNGRRAIKGRCATCGTVMFKILGGKGAAPAPAPAEEKPPQPLPPGEVPAAPLPPEPGQ